STGVVTREDIEEVVARWTGIAVTSIKEDEQQKLLRIEPELHKRVISQDKAITALARAIRRSRAGLKSPMRPVGCFFFLGPTGVGKKGSRPPLGRIFVWVGEVAGSFRYVGVHGKALRIEAHRRASGVCGLRRRRSIDRARPPDALLRHPAG